MAEAGTRRCLRQAPDRRKSPRRLQHNVAPVEVRRTFIEMREPEQNRSDHERCPASQAPFQQILHPGAKKEFLGTSDENEDIDPRRNHREPQRVAMGMQKAQRQPSCENQGRKVNQFAQPGFAVAAAEMKVRAASTRSSFPTGL